MRTGSPSPLLLALAALALPARADVIRQTDGKTLTEERAITLTGGEAQELAIDINSIQLAQAN